MKDKYLTTGSVITALLSSLCCIGPLILISIGIGSTAFFLQFNELRLYLIGASIIFLVPAFYLVYKKREIKCEDGTCKNEIVSKWNKAGVWTGTFAVLFFISFPYLGFDTSAAKNENTKTESYTIVKLQINNMDCEACARGLESQLNKLDGVKAANINYSKENGLIEYDSLEIKKKLLIEFLEDEGFPSKEINKKQQLL